MKPRAGWWLGLLIPLSASADETLLGCRSIEVESERLACYDRVVDRVKSEMTPEEPVTAGPRASSFEGAEPLRGLPASDPHVERSWRERWFGRSESADERTLRERYGAADEQRLVANVATAQRSGDRTWIVTLENGQVWRQTELSSFLVRPGDPVEIEAGALDAYYMRRVGRGKQIRVKRIR